MYKHNIPIKQYKHTHNIPIYKICLNPGFGPKSKTSGKKVLWKFNSSSKLRSKNSFRKGSKKSRVVLELPKQTQPYHLYFTKKLDIDNSPNLSKLLNRKTSAGLKRRVRSKKMSNQQKRRNTLFFRSASPSRHNLFNMISF